MNARALAVLASCPLEGVGALDLLARYRARVEALRLEVLRAWGRRG